MICLANNYKMTIEPYIILTPLLGLILLFILFIYWITNKLNKFQECRDAGINTKDLYNYYKKRFFETKEEKEKREMNSWH